MKINYIPYLYPVMNPGFYFGMDYCIVELYNKEGKLFRIDIVSLTT